MKHCIKYLSIALLCCITQVIDGAVAQQSRNIAAGQGAQSGSNIVSAIAANDDDTQNDFLNLADPVLAPATTPRHTTTNNDDDDDTVLQTTTTAPDNTVTFREIALRMAANSRLPPRLFCSFIAPGANINTRDFLEQTLLHHAALEEDTTSVTQLLDLGANVHAVDYTRRTPLHAAISGGCIPIIKALLAADANVHAQDHNDDTPLQMAYRTRNNIIIDLVVTRNANTIARNFSVPLLRIFPGVNDADTNGNSPLHRAVNPRLNLNSNNTVASNLNPDPNEVVLLLSHGADLDAQNHIKETALHLAAKHNNADIAPILIRYGANVNAANVNSYTPLHLAVRNNNIVIVQALLMARSIDIEARIYRCEYTALHIAAQQGNTDIMKLLIDAGAKINATDNDHWTPILVAAANGHTACVEILITAGANISFAALHRHPATLKKLIDLVAYIKAKNNACQNPSDITKEQKHTETVTLLSDNGNYSATANDITDRGDTVLHIAAKRKNNKYITKLTQAGHNPNAANNHGNTPLHTTAQNNNLLAAMALKNAGALLNIRNGDGHTPADIAAMNNNLILAEILRPNTTIANYSPAIIVSA